MRKGFILSLFILCGILFSACTPGEEVETELTRYSETIFSMHAAINIQIYTETRNQFNEYVTDIEAIYETYDTLTDNYQSDSDLSALNIYDINQIVNAVDAEAQTTLEISSELYELLEFGLEIEAMTNGYFNMSMGYLVDLWKELLEDYEHGEVVPDNVLDATKEAADAYQFIEDPVTLEVVDGKYQLTMKKGAKLDLGALAKGYATQKAADYLEANDVKYYLISGGSSSIVMGEKPTVETGLFKIGLQHPLLYPQSTYYGLFNLKNVSITTSGSYEQYVTDSQSNWITHIISPVTRRPANYYYTLTLIGEDAGLLDGLSTALFCMDQETLNDFLEDYDIEAIGFDINEETIRVNPTERLED